MQDNLNEPRDNESWGVRDFQIYVANCHSTCVTCNGAGKNECMTCLTGYVFTTGECIRDFACKNIFLFVFR